MEATQSSETSAFNIQTPGKYPEDNSSLLQHGESLKSLQNLSKFCWPSPQIYRSSQRKSNKIQQCIKILFNIYMKLNMFRATRRPSSGD
jgi:hypothetical protein